MRILDRAPASKSEEVADMMDRLYYYEEYLAEDRDKAAEYLRFVARSWRENGHPSERFMPLVTAAHDVITGNLHTPESRQNVIQQLGGEVMR